MNDYPSARFRNVRAVADRQGEVGFCGEFNAKNAYGGYVGWTPFYVSTFQMSLGLGEGDIIPWAMHCNPASPVSQVDQVDYSSALSPPPN